MRPNKLRASSTDHQATPTGRVHVTHPDAFHQMYRRETSRARSVGAARKHQQPNQKNETGGLIQGQTYEIQDSARVILCQYLLIGGSASVAVLLSPKLPRGVIDRLRHLRYRAYPCCTFVGGHGRGHVVHA